jgi:hypothetical protein
MAVVEAGAPSRTVDPRPLVVRERPSLAARTGWLVAAAALLLSAYLTWDGLRLRDQVATLSSQLARRPWRPLNANRDAARRRRASNLGHGRADRMTWRASI